jgi:hypothetical protein
MKNSYDEWKEHPMKHLLATTTLAAALGVFGAVAAQAAIGDGIAAGTTPAGKAQAGTGAAMPSAEAMVGAAAPAFTVGRVRAMARAL